MGTFPLVRNARYTESCPFISFLQLQQQQNIYKWFQIIQTNGICKNQNLSMRVRNIKSFGTLRFKWITQSRPEDQIQLSWTRRKKCDMMDFAVPVNYRVKLKEIENWIRIWTSVKNWRNNRTWKWQLCSLLLECLETLWRSLLIRMEELVIQVRIKIIQRMTLLKKLV